MEPTKQGVSDLMATIDLGTITTNRVSLYKVSATTTLNNVILSYSYKDGRLPPGLSITPDGEIIGKVTNKLFKLDQGDTTFGETTIDKTHVFTVTARGQFGNVTSDQSFSIDVVDDTNVGEVGNMYGQLRPDSASLDAWQLLVSDNKIFPNDSVYRSSDVNFNTDQPGFLFLSGVALKLNKDIIDLFRNNNFNIKFTTGDYVLATAKDNVSNVLYEVVYVELIDPNAGANDHITLTNQNLPRITVQLRADTLEIKTDESITVPGTTVDKIYSNDIINMQNEVKDGLTVNNFDYLPLWMKTPESPVIGYRLALPIKFLKPGRGGQALYRLKNESNYDAKSLDIDIDRWVLDNNLGTTFDDVSSLIHTGDGSTTVIATPHTPTKDNHLLITINGLGIATSEYAIRTTADCTSETADGGSILVNDSCSQNQVVFADAPQNGSQINIRLKPTSFGNLVVTTFDDSTVATTFDGNGTRFIGETVTFDRKQNPQQQLMFPKASNTDQITHVSKHRELVRTV